jgi:hypothetical protein
MYDDVKKLIRAEMERSIEATGDVTSYANWTAANKAYSVLRTLDASAARGLKKQLEEQAGAKAGGSIMRVLGRAGMSTLLFGQPYSLLYDAAGGSLFKAIGTAADSIGRKAGALAGQMTATQAARESFTKAVREVTVRGATNVSGVKPISKDMEKYLSGDKFNELMDRIRAGGIDDATKRVLADIDPSFAEEATKTEAKIRDNVVAMLPKPSPYPVGYMPTNKKYKSLIDTDEMKVLRYLDGVADPMSIPMKVVAGVAGPEHVKALRDIFPGLYGSMRDGFIQDMISGKLDQGELEVPQVRAALSSFFDFPVSAVNGPQFAQAMATVREEDAQAQEEAKKGEGGGGGGGQSGPSSANYKTESERIER